MTTCQTFGNDQNVVTEMRYGPGGQLIALIAKNPATGDQVTRYEYGVTLAESEVASNDLLRAEVYPDSSDSSDRVTYCYNRQGQRTRMQDQNGTVHEYEYDLLGRHTADKVPTVAAGIDDAVLRIGQSYEVRGMVEKITSYSDAAGTTVVNKVQNVYNDFGQLTIQYQEHDGAVNTGTTVNVQYGYANGSANTIRQTSLTYPSGQVLDYLYDDEAADKLSRIRTLKWDGTNVCQYSYLGLSTFVITDYLEPQIKLDYALGTSGSDLYPGFDRFGRIVDFLWESYGTSSSSSSSSSGGAGNDLVHLKYGYDRASNRTYRADLVAQSYDKDFDELYEYDGLHRLKKFHRGRLTDDDRAVTNPTFQQGWQLDATGNWKNFTQNDQADPDQTLDQQRVANRVNEITQIARTVGADWVTPEYDRNGNSTVIPQPKDITQAFQGTWDAWNRLARIESYDLACQMFQINRFDGLSRRTARRILVDGNPTEQATFLYSDGWQCLEEVRSSPDELDWLIANPVWGIQYVDDLITYSSQESDNSLPGRIYSLCDAIWSTQAILSIDGTCIERYSYASYGEASCLTSLYEPSESTTQNSLPYLFCGYYTDSSQLLLARYRYYHSSLGLWLSRDPVSQDGTHANLYVYSNSLITTDAFGLFPSGPACELGGEPTYNFRIVKYHVVNEVNDIFGGRVQIDAKFKKGSADSIPILLGKKGCCQCCEYRQYVVGTFKTRRSALAGWTIDRSYFFEEDQFAGRHYGHRDDPADAVDYYSLDGCGYSMVDNIGLNGVRFAVHTKYFDLEISILLISLIIDTCNDDKTIWHKNTFVRAWLHATNGKFINGRDESFPTPPPVAKYDAPALSAGTTPTYPRFQ